MYIHERGDLDFAHILKLYAVALGSKGLCSSVLRLSKMWNALFFRNRKMTD